LHIGLLGNVVQDAYGGINYVVNLIRALAALPPDSRPRLTLFRDLRAPNAAAFESVRPLVDSLAALPAPAAAGLSPAERLARIAGRLSGWWSRGVLKAARQAGCQVLFPTATSLGRVLPGSGPVWIGWAYDLQHVRHPEFFSTGDLRRRGFYFAGVARDAVRIVVSSQAARADWLELYPATAPRVSVLSFTTVPRDSWYAGSPAEVAARYRLPHKFLMLPNQFWIHKDHATAFEAVRQLRERGLSVTLVCTGATRDRRHPEHFGRLQQWIEQHGLADQIRIAGLVPAEDQTQLLRAASALVQPSLFEGWSTVVEEARALGKRIYLSDLPVHREQQPPGGRFFPAGDGPALADAIAAEWDALEPGPDTEQECLARGAQAGRVRAYAETFAQIAEQSHRPVDDLP
jgi:glycosyltransferase involved in cell wall biosynthesis